MEKEEGDVRADAGSPGRSQVCYEEDMRGEEGDGGG